MGGNSAFSYNALDQLISVTDPNGHTTSYSYNTFADKTQQTSPDTGTSSYTYDKAGNLLTATDARGITVSMSYDALNRVTSETYPDSTLDKAYSYDTCTLGKGRLCQITDASGSTLFDYDADGNPVLETRVYAATAATPQTIHVIGYGYGYDNMNRLTQITQPNGRVINYTRNIAGQITGATITDTSGANPQTLVSNISYQPFGGIEQLTYGNGILLTQGWDLQGRLTSQLDQGTATVRNVSYQFDAVNNITGITNAVSQTFGYDDLDRLISDSGSYGSKSFSYDAIGNRLSQTHDTTTTNYGYDADSSQLLTIDGVSLTYDAMGNQTDKANEQWVYDDRGRPVSYKLNGQLVASYQYNAHGQRTHRTIHGASTVTIHYLYNTAGQLIAQRRFDNGTPVSDTDYIWIDSQPIAQIETPYQGTPASPDDANAVVTYLHTDQLNTPRIGTDSNQVIVWRWDSDAFGLGPPNEDPDGNSQNVTVDLRFPGQIASDGGVYYNYFRDYDPSTGRYIESDPIGLDGGLNTYGYVGGSPLIFDDPLGLLKAPGGTVVRGWTLNQQAIQNIYWPSMGQEIKAENLPNAPYQDPWEGYGDVSKDTTDHNPGTATETSSTECKSNCKKCTPPEGTVCYTIEHTKRPHKGLSPHRHLFRMTQDKDCNCRWKPYKKGAGKPYKGAVGFRPAATIPCPFNAW